MAQVTPNPTMRCSKSSMTILWYQYKESHQSRALFKFTGGSIRGLGNGKVGKFLLGASDVT